MILTTTNSIEGFKIEDYLGIVTGVALNEETLSASFSMSKYMKKIQVSVDNVKEIAFKRLQENAKKLKANAVVGIKVEVELTTHNYPMVSVTGTAVKVAV
ncbi:YbjQ family protein [Winogradskyella immobilis]|uniref:Heavy metal-binding domain-containing protein n=1 Tax=Winogradskyella immobilis TaxID=2816852 RepID=A0ABS8EK87_9FLAO|nr:heavy metal-binding domain-containing protein [Winogradskyella immobilis]MCC1483441.1 heavy metal-binding domain-containing protein [Winogradskyella immobilis]MCG0015535.1 YbjQ family protein [Winogradskyella immobilis]